MKWTISFYNAKVMQGILEWPAGIKAKFVWITDLIEEFGPDEIGMPHLKAMSQGLFEIRAKGKEGIGRAFFCMVKGNKIIITSAFIKKTQKTPSREIELAKQRMRELKSND